MVLRVPSLVAGQSTAQSVPGSTIFEQDDSDYLNRTPTTAGNRRTWTIGFWVKRGQLSDTQYIFESGTADTAANRFIIRFDSGDTILCTTGQAADKRTNALYRDISGWGHFVLAVDTTQASAGDRFKLYWNGERITSFSSDTNPSQNFEMGVNDTTPQNIGRSEVDGSVAFLEASLSQYYLIDGQALEPSYFGFTDPLTNTWRPKKYSGATTQSDMWPLDSDIVDIFNSNSFTETGGSSSFISAGTNSFGLSNCVNYAADGKYLSYAISPSPQWTIDFYVKFDDVTSGSNSYFAGWDAFPGNECTVGIKKSDSTWVVWGGTNLYTSTVAAIDTWYHVRLSSSGSSNLKLYVNGTLIGTDSGSDQNPASPLNFGDMQSGRFDGQIAGVRYIPEDLGAPTSGGEVTGDGSLPNIENTYIHYGTNGFFLPLDGTGYAGAFQTAGNMGQDQSGLQNNYTVNGSPSYTTDSPSGVSASVDTSAGLTTTGYATNYVTWNPLYKHSDISMSYGNTVANGPSAGAARPFACSFGMDTGKWYWEIACIRGAWNNGGQRIGIGRLEFDYSGTDTPGNDDYSWAVSNERDFRHNNSIVQTDYVPDEFVTGTTAMFALDMDNGKFWMGTNGVWGTSSAGLGDPANGVNPIVDSGLTGVGPIFPCQDTGSDSGANSLTLNSGQTPFAYGAPKGFLPLCAANAPRRGILPKDYFGIVEYTGDGNSPRSFTGLGFAPDLIWYKETTEDRDHQLYDTVRGVGPGKNLVSNTEYAQASNDDTSYGYTSSFDRDGWTVTNGSSGGNENIYTNKSGQGYVCWGWKAGGNKNTFNIDGVGYASAAAAGLDGGGITPTGASVGTKQGFSIIGYTGTGSNSSFSHGLGTNPAFMIFKNLSAGEDWCVYHVDIQTGSTRWTEGNYALLLNKKDHYAYGTGFFANTFPTTSLVKVGTSGLVNTSGQDYIAYIWTEVPGLQRFGKYIGRGAANYVYLGFKPKLVMCKRYVANSSPDTSTDYTSWSIYDTTRNTYNGETPNQLWANCYASEGKRGNCSATSNLGDMRIEAHATGFYMNGPGSSVNADTGGYIYAAWADQPEGNIYGAQSLAR